MPRTVSVQRQFVPASPVRHPAARQAAASAHGLAAGRGTDRAGALPGVSIHVPICNEPPASVQGTLDALSRLDYPDFEVLVISSNTADPALWEPVAEHCARLGARFRFFHLGQWPGGKAGALNFALWETAPDAAVIGVLDSGTVVRPDWLRRMVPNFADPAVGFAWSPEADPAASPWTLDVPAASGADVIPGDAMTLVRRAAIEQAGGWAEWALTEDAELGVRLLRCGWRGACSRESFGGSGRPEGYTACSRQQFRQAYGAMQICRAHLLALVSPFDPALTLGQRGKLLSGWLSCFSDALGVLLLVAALAWSAGLVLAPGQVAFPAPPLTLVPVLLFAITLLRVLHHTPRQTSWRSYGAAALTGLALSHAAGNGAWQALLGGDPPPDDAAGEQGLPQRPAPVRAELGLLLLAWAAIAGVALVHGFDQPIAYFWCAMLLVQSLPCLAATVAAFSAAGTRTSQRISPLPHGAISR